MGTTRVKFRNDSDYELSAYLERPVDQKPVAYAVFAHCFSCNKNLNAVQRIAEALTRNGFGVLRFDFTGLGESEGDFEDTNFSSNIQDLHAAARYLAHEHAAPTLMIGHSLGGAAAIFAAAHLESVKAVATIGAPAAPDHIRHLFQEDIDTIKKEGVAEVAIAGRSFRIKKQFLEDISSQNMTDTLANLRKPLLILHSPQDRVVGIDNAREIYEAAHHPKSFISLDGADHLLTNQADAAYVGEVIASWADRYLSSEHVPELRSEHQVLVRIGEKGFTTDIKAGKHRLRADEPESVGGHDFGPTPYDLLLASLGTCTAMTLRMYADRKKWEVGEIRVHLNHAREHRADCDACEDPKSKIDVIDRIIEVRGDVDEPQKKRLLEIADKCPVHKTLHGKIRVDNQISVLTENGQA